MIIISANCWFFCRIIFDRKSDSYGFFVYSKRSAESFIDLTKKYSLNGLMTESRVMCISEKVLNVFKEAGWKNLETFETGDELIKIGN